MIKHITNTYNASKTTVWKQAVQKLVNGSELALGSNKESLNTPPVFALIMTINQGLLGVDYIQKIEVMIHHINIWLNDKSQDWCFLNIDCVSKDNITKNSVSLEVLDSMDLADSMTEIGSTIEATNDRLSDVTVLRFVVCLTTDGLDSGSEVQCGNAYFQKELNQKISEYFANQHIDNQLMNAFVDYHILPISNVINTPKMVCFDMDSTLIEQEVIVEIAKATGIGEKVNEITELAMRGDIEFNESFEKRVSLLHDTSADVLDKINDNLTLSAGAMTTLAVLNALGCHTVLLSGGFTYFANMVAGKLNIDEYHANTLLVKEGKVVGEVQLPIVDGQRKADLVQQIANEQGIQLSEVVCVGDGANDLAMMAVSGLGMAYHAKPIVQKQADTAINCTGLEGVLYALGFPRIDFST